MITISRKRHRRSDRTRAHAGADAGAHAGADADRHQSEPGHISVQQQLPPARTSRWYVLCSCHVLWRLLAVPSEAAIGGGRAADGKGVRQYLEAVAHVGEGGMAAHPESREGLANDAARDHQRHAQRRDKTVHLAHTDRYSILIPSVRTEAWCRAPAANSTPGPHACKLRPHP